MWTMIILYNPHWFAMNDKPLVQKECGPQLLLYFLGDWCGWEFYDIECVGFILLNVQQIVWLMWTVKKPTWKNWHGPT